MSHAPPCVYFTKQQRPPVTVAPPQAMCISQSKGALQKGRRAVFHSFMKELSMMNVFYIIILILGVQLTEYMKIPTVGATVYPSLVSKHD